MTQTSNDERVQRYGRAIWEASRADEGTISYIGANHVARAVMAVADAEQAELRAELAEEEQAAADRLDYVATLVADVDQLEASLREHEVRAAEIEMFLHQQCGVDLEAWQRQWIESYFAGSSCPRTENAALRAEVERLRVSPDHVEDLLGIDPNDPLNKIATYAVEQRNRAEAAEAKVARVEALRAHLADPANRSSGPSTKRGRVVADVIDDVLREIAVALAGPADEAWRP